MIQKSQSINRPPYFNGANYSHWKNRMTLFIKANGYAVWDIIMDDKLEVTHEGTNQVKKSKLGILTLDYESFKMKPKEDIKEMFDRVMKKNVGKALKSTTNSDSESKEEVDEDKEMEMFARRFKRFMKSNKGREFQKKEGLKLESTEEKDLIICYECKKLRHVKYDCPQLKRKGSSKLKTYVAAWSDKDSSDDEVANLCLMAINDPKGLDEVSIRFGT
ncbi:hypothetical protein V6Z12_D06G095400 [Gossypium hirsutum]